MPPSRARNHFGPAMLFLAPNILGFLVFTLVPLLLSLGLAFTNWDLKKHNVFLDNPIQFVGLDNFRQLFNEPNFWEYFGNTLFLMLSIPFCIAGSLCAAMLLQPGDGRRYAPKKWMAVLGLVFGTAVAVLAAGGMGKTALVMVFIALFGSLMAGGVGGGVAVFRTAFYLPCFTSGVAVYLLWKKLYNPVSGPVNAVIQPPLTWFTDVLHAMGRGPADNAAFAVAVLLALLFAGWGLLNGRFMRRGFRDGELGWMAIALCMVGLLVSLYFAVSWALPLHPALGGLSIAGVVLGLLGGLAARWPGGDPTTVRLTRECPRDRGIGTALLLAGGGAFLTAVLAGLMGVALAVPEWAAGPEGLTAPKWLADRNWAKPALMLMGFWAAIGSNNMLLYLAGLSNIPVELYEAADIDGASRWQRFWHVTWPNLAPVTFFIVVLAIIGGLQGGFESARTMTQGGPAGATTTLAYFIYTEGFETGRLGYASAIAWMLCLLVFVVTLFNWRFGSRYADD